MHFQGARAAGWETRSHVVRYKDDHLAVATVETSSPAKPDGRRWTVVHRAAAVVVAPMTRAGELILIREERIPVQEALWSVPAGQMDDDAEMAAVARRELEEETGYTLAADGEMHSLGHYFTSPGFTDERGHFFLAQPVEPGPRGAAHHESESILDCRAFAPPEIAGLIARNEIRDANTLSICAVLAARGQLSLGQ